MEYQYPNINPHCFDPTDLNIAFFGSAPTSIFDGLKLNRNINIYRCGYVYDTVVNRQKRLEWTVNVLGFAQVMVISGVITVEEALMANTFKGKSKYYLTLMDFHRDYYHVLGYNPYFTNEELVEKINYEYN